MQEGWHYELESEDAPLTINGVVYNEMKGAYSSPDEVLGDGNYGSTVSRQHLQQKFRRKPGKNTGTDV